MITTWQRYQSEHPRVLDAALALLLIGCAFPGSMLGTPTTRAVDPWWPAVLIVTASCVALRWRRTRPGLVTALVAAGAIAASGLGFLPSPLLLGSLMVALFTLADRTERKNANSAAFPIMAAVAAAAVLGRPRETFALTVVMPIAFLLLPLALGTTARTKRAYLEAVQARAAFAEQNREQEARHRVAEERMRIARELHDVVAHHLALANAQAGTAAHIARTRPEQVREILVELTTTTSAALRELKATVGLLRESDDPDAPLQPAPGLAQLPDLTASLASAGLKVVVTTEGTARALSPGVDLTAFRIVQEALTNVTKHAATDTAYVQLDYGNDRLTITVTDDEDGASRSAPVAATATAATAKTPGGGFGLIGMRERANSIGGRLQAGRRPEGGFEVTAELPLQL
ncbi:sensor histidine kinase [Actinocrinis sp.]|uniref:sensor histidine kinase n=1 Tax=Actinocrinis sp. TaxID=1920516 RepID=UPI002C0DFCED|nr:sensor histidine kinase [Actinocrinis sp.]HXR69285.1 sensor histidine kinase [Actinocrinis sp.]